MIEENIYDKEKTQKMISALREILERMRVITETAVKNADIVIISDEFVSNKILDVIKLDEFESKTIDDDITSLKKKIKYCKNPLEKKNLEQRLNVAYKKRKRKNGNL